MTRKQLIEGVLFLPAMAVLAAVVWLAGVALIKGGAWLLRGWFWLLTEALPLPRSAALALAVVFAAVSVYALLHLAGRRRAQRLPRKA